MNKFFKHGLALAALLSLSLPLSAFSQQIVSQEIVLDPYNDDFEVEQVVIVPGSPLELSLLNFSPDDLTFSSPELGMEVVIPANTQKVVYVDAATLATLEPGETIAYSILDASGNELASSELINNQVVYTFESTQTVTTTETTTGTSAVRQEPERSSTVRGFW